MKNRILIAVAIASLAAACGRDSVRSRQQQDYQVVQEGAASGVTSTIAAPGESTPPLTSTNADTTSAFTINPNVVATAPQGGTIAGTLPQGVPASYQPPVASVPSQPRASTPTTIPAPMTSASTAPPRESQPPQTTTQQTQTHTETQPEPAPQTDTTTTTTTTTTTQAPPPQTHTETAPPPKKDDTQQQQQQPTEDDDSEPEEQPAPPPPPPAY